MKTYILSGLDRLKKYSQKLDAEAILYDKKWEVFNDTGDKEVLIFRPNKDLLISRNGRVTKGQWEILSPNTLLIEVDSKAYLLNSAFVDNTFLALQMDGTNEVMVMVEEEFRQKLQLDNIEKVNKYLSDTEKEHNVEEDYFIYPDKKQDEEYTVKEEYLTYIDKKQDEEYLRTTGRVLVIVIILIFLLIGFALIY